MIGNYRSPSFGIYLNTPTTTTLFVTIQLEYYKNLSDRNNHFHLQIIRFIYTEAKSQKIYPNDVLNKKLIIELFLYNMYKTKYN